MEDARKASHEVTHEKSESRKREITHKESSTFRN